MGLHLQIITSPGERLRRNHLISHLVEIWKGEGIHISVGPTPRLEADLGILHVDRTLVAPALLPENPDGHPILNSAILDISKRRISNHILGPESGFDGSVIIKTDANAGGGPERSELSPLNWRRLRRRFTKALSWRVTRELPWGGYPVLDRLDDVPEWVWQRKDLVVEKFQPEMDGRDYVLRVWLFFGSKEYGARLVGNHPVVKAGRVIRYEYTETVPDSIREARKRLGLDFGKFDYVMVNGEAILLDVNKTPTVVTTPGKSNRNLIHLASGLREYLETVE